MWTQCYTNLNISTPIQEESTYVSICIEHMLVRSFEPLPKGEIVLKPEERITKAIPVRKIPDVITETCAHFVHELRMRNARAHADRDQLLCKAVKDFDLHKRCVRVASGYGRTVYIRHGARATSTRIHASDGTKWLGMCRSIRPWAVILRLAEAGIVQCLTIVVMRHHAS